MEASNTSKKSMTNEERLELAAKLDKDLDDFISGLERRSNTEGWQEDKWEEEMEKHPFFMTKTPEGNEPLPPLLEGIQQLKYDDSENSPRELAINYKEDGNFNFKCKKYRMAILSYTEGIRKKCGDSEIEAQLYNNRGAAQFFLKNYRSSLRDCLQALKFDPSYHKARIRAAQCYIELHQADDAIQLCDEVLETHPTDPQALGFRTKAVNLQKMDLRNERKENLRHKKQMNEVEQILSAVRDRKININCSETDVVENFNLAQEKPKLIDNCLTWPVFFLYPEHQTSDFIVDFHEDSTFLHHLIEMFSTPPDWDSNRTYVIINLAMYYENGDHLYAVDLGHTLKQTLSLKTFIVNNWKPTFYIVVKNSEAEKRFLKDYTVHLYKY